MQHLPASESAVVISPRILLLRTLLACAVLALWPCVALALDPALKLSQYQHTSWAGVPGAPSQVRAIVQTPEGFLWLATPEGLTRFDGVAFEPIQVLGGQPLGTVAVRSLCPDASGGIWMTLGGDAALYKHGVLTRFKGRDVSACLEVDGVTWLISNARLVRFSDGRLQEDGTAWGLPNVLASALFVDKRSRIWVFDETSSTLSYLARGETVFRLAKTSSERPLATAAAPDGSLLGGTSRGLVKVSAVADGTFRSSLITHRAMTTPFFDGRGGFWAGDIHGLIHAGSLSAMRDEPSGESIASDAFTPQQGLSSDVVWTVFEDRQGNIWVGTGGGLDRFRDTAFVPIRLPGRALPFAMAAKSDGAVIAANWNAPPVRADKTSRVEKVNLGPEPPEWGFSTLFPDTDGTTWFAANGDELWHSSPDGSWSYSRIPADLAGERVDGIARDTSGALWIASGKTAAVLRLKNGTWSQPRGPGLPAKWFASHIAADHEGRIWAAQGDQIIAFDRDHGVRFDKALNGLDVGNVTAFFDRGPGSPMWVGGVSGVAAFDGRNFHALKVEGTVPPIQVSGLVEASNGDLWINCRGGGFRISNEELRKFRANPDAKVVARHFDTLDGLSGLEPADYGQATVAEGSDGSIWMASKLGVSYFDAARAMPDAPFPGTRIESISTPEVRKAVVASPIVLPPLNRSVDVSFTAPGLGVPERIHFRVRLDGVDETWRESGPRRVASYIDLAPGSYRFHVMSTNESGEWGGGESTVDFRIEPAWFQTWAFRVAAAVLFLTAARLAYRARVSHLTSRVRLQMKAQQAERERIARELHDTLLQGVQGLIWRFQTLSSHLVEGDPVRHGMEAALDTAESMLVESRDRVRDLRDPNASSSPLMEELRELGEGMAMDQPVAFALAVTGAERDMRASVSSEIMDIAREALANAFNHAEASRVDVVAIFGRRYFELVISDDGHGIEPAVIKNGKLRHFGLAGMRERARALRATFELLSTPAQGTRIRLRLKAARAYASSTSA